MVFRVSLRKIYINQIFSLVFSRVIEFMSARDNWLLSKQMLNLSIVLETKSAVNLIFPELHLYHFTFIL